VPGRDAASALEPLDLRDQAAVNYWFRANRPEFVFLVAGTVGGILANSTRPAEFIYENLAIQVNVIEAARRAGRHLLVAGGWRPSFTGAIRYVGEVDNRRKAVLLARARCVWNPALWDDPFGLVNIEALLSGTPIVATHRGALPEIVTPEVGALGDTLEELIALAETIGTRAPDACRAHAERHFTHLRMAEGYVAVYDQLLRTGELPHTAHTTS